LQADIRDHKDYIPQFQFKNKAREKSSQARIINDINKLLHSAKNWFHTLMLKNK